MITHGSHGLPGEANGHIMGTDIGPDLPVVPPEPTRPGKNGGRLKTGGRHYRPGRPTNEYIAYCMELLSSRETEASVRAILRNPKHPAFATIYKILSDRAYGRPVQPLAGHDGGALIPPHDEVEAARQQIRARLEQLAPNGHTPERIP